MQRKGRFGGHTNRAAGDRAGQPWASCWALAAGAPPRPSALPSPQSLRASLTALLRVLVGVVPAVVLAVALPRQGLAQGVVALELVQRAGPHYRPGAESQQRLSPGSQGPGAGPGPDPPSTVEAKPRAGGGTAGRDPGIVFDQSGQLGRAASSAISGRKGLWEECPGGSREPSLVVAAGHGPPPGRGARGWESGGWVPARPQPPGQSQDACPPCRGLTGFTGPCRLRSPPGQQAPPHFPGKEIEQRLCFSGQPTAFWERMGKAGMDIARRFCWIPAQLAPGPGLVWVGVGRAHRQCRRLPRRCRPCSQRPHHSASAGGCSARSCTGTGPCHSGACSPSVGRGAASWSDLGPRRPCSDRPLPVSLPTSSEPSAQSWSPSHFQRPAMQRPLAQENSLSEQGRGAGEGRDRPREVGVGTQPSRAPPALGRGRPPIAVFLKAAADWHDDQNAQPIPCGHWLSSGGQPGTEGTHSPLGHTQEGGHGSLALPSGHTVCGEGRGGTRPLRQAPGFRERPVRDDGLRHGTGMGGLWAGAGCGGSTAHRRHLPL